MENNKITFKIELPYEFRIVRYGNNDYVELEILEKDWDMKEKKYKDTRSWKFAGYHGSVLSAIKQYINICPVKRLEGEVKLTDVNSMYRQIQNSINSILREVK